MNDDGMVNECVGASGIVVWDEGDVDKEMVWFKWVFAFNFYYSNPFFQMVKYVFNSPKKKPAKWF